MKTLKTMEQFEQGLVRFERDALAKVRFGWSTMGAWVWKTSGASSWWPGVGPWWPGQGPDRVPEPAFVAFNLAGLESAAPAASDAARGPAASEMTAANEWQAPATLHELGVPAELAHGFELTFRAMGAAQGGRVQGYSFRTASGARHPVKIDDDVGAAA